MLSLQFFQYSIIQKYASLYVYIYIFFYVIQLQNVFCFIPIFLNDSSIGNAETPQICVKPKYQVIQQMIQRASSVSIEARTSAQLSVQRVTSSTLQI